MKNVKKNLTIHFFTLYEHCSLIYVLFWPKTTSQPVNKNRLAQKKWTIIPNNLTFACQSTNIYIKYNRIRARFTKQWKTSILNFCFPRWWFLFSCVITGPSNIISVFELMTIFSTERQTGAEGCWGLIFRPAAIIHSTHESLYVFHISAKGNVTYKSTRETANKEQ